MLRSTYHVVTAHGVTTFKDMKIVTILNAYCRNEQGAWYLVKENGQLVARYRSVK